MDDFVLLSHWLDERGYAICRPEDVGFSALAWTPLTGEDTRQVAHEYGKTHKSRWRWNVEKQGWVDVPPEESGRCPHCGSSPEPLP